MLKKYRGSGGNVRIPSGVTSIGDWAFYGCSGLTSVEIPTGVTNMPDYECKLTNTKKGDRRERSELVRVGDSVNLAMSADGSRINFLTAAGDVGDVSSDSWLKAVLAEQIPYQAEIITSIPYSRLESKRMNPVIEVRLHIDATKTEMKKRLGWDYIPSEIYGSGKFF